ncbi:hypothetical protein BDP27DRAFT_1416577 [Rhodocollybia butyracea]|uniref:Uncharacterized protein n=1 Tax=Rhodocollybia butyracea TaxID=206335 RepID=A0A9P5UBM6_9AGAR|nr:hypothetical protein BDP27DRAFT_1416577 [Rhodocollybia butyracea]
MLRLCIAKCKVGIYTHRVEQIGDVQQAYATSDPPPTTPGYLYILKDELAGFEQLSGGENALWLIDVAHGLCDPRQKRGHLPPVSPILSIFDPCFGICLCKNLYACFDDYEVGFRKFFENGQVRYYVHDFTSKNINIYGLDVDLPGYPLPPLHGTCVTPPDPTSPPPGLLFWHYLQCVIHKSGHQMFKNLANIVHFELPMRMEDDSEDEDSKEGFWPSAILDLGSIPTFPGDDLHPITAEGDEAGVQELGKAPNGALDNVTVGIRGGMMSKQYAPVTRTNANSRSPIAKDNTHVLATEDLSQGKNAGDGGGMQEHRKATSGGELDNVVVGNKAKGRYEEQTTVIQGYR